MPYLAVELLAPFNFKFNFSVHFGGDNLGLLVRANS